MIDESSWKIKQVYGVTTIRKKGFSQIDKFISVLFPSLANTLIFVCQKL